MSSTLKTLARRLHATSAHLGFNPLNMLSLRHLPAYLNELKTYRELAASQPEAMPLSLTNLYPILTDKSDSAGVTSSHYFQMDLFMARLILAENPKNHIDIGSRIDGFIGHLLASQQPTTMVDIRPLPNPPKGLEFIRDDATTLNSFKDASIPSLSSLHAAEHFGLGRYNDPIDPLACYNFMRSMARVLAKGGKLYFATPIGRERLEFNAHRVFSPQTIHNLFVTECGLKLHHSAVITSRGDLIDPADPLQFGQENFACGLYVFTRK